MNIDKFNYKLPKELIAQYPPKNRGIPSKIGDLYSAINLFSSFKGSLHSIRLVPRAVLILILLSDTFIESWQSNPIIEY